METLVKQVIDSNPNAPMMVIFGGSPNRMNEVISLIKQVGGITVYGAFSEEEGLALLNTHPNLQLVLIGGRYTNEQRIRIRNYVATHLPNTKLTEPGHDYPYDNTFILKDIKEKLGII
jgi:hypothetical protein